VRAVGLYAGIVFATISISNHANWENKEMKSELGLENG